MKVSSYSDFRQRLKHFLSQVISSGDPLYVTQKNGQEVVVLSKSDCEGIQETLHLLSSPKNAARLKEALEEYNSGGGTIKKLIED